MTCRDYKRRVLRFILVTCATMTSLYTELLHLDKSQKTRVHFTYSFSSCKVERTVASILPLSTRLLCLFHITYIVYIRTSIQYTLFVSGHPSPNSNRQALRVRHYTHPVIPHKLRYPISWIPTRPLRLSIAPPHLALSPVTSRRFDRQVSHYFDRTISTAVLYTLYNSKHPRDWRAQQPLDTTRPRLFTYRIEGRNIPCTEVSRSHNDRQRAGLVLVACHHTTSTGTPSSLSPERVPILVNRSPPTPRNESRPILLVCRLFIDAANVGWVIICHQFDCSVGLLPSAT